MAAHRPQSGAAPAADAARLPGPQGGDGERHRQPMVAGGIGFAALQLPVACDVESIVHFLDVSSERAEAFGQRGDAVALLVPQLAGRR